MNDFTGAIWQVWPSNANRDFRSLKDFTADKFIPTKWDSAVKKAHFARQFIRFVESDFDAKRFLKTLYQRLSLTFGHIAHFNRQGFFDTFFSTIEGKVQFLRQTLQHSCCGDPEFTYSDVERALQSWMQQHAFLAKYENQQSAETETAERKEWARLQGKYGFRHQ